MQNKQLAIHFSVELYSAESHLFRVTCNIKNTNKDGFKYYMPAWIPGSYMIRDFAKNFVEMNAKDSNDDLAITLIDKQTWSIGKNNGEVSLQYDVYAWDESVRTAHFDNTHAYFNGTSLFVGIEGREDEAISLEIIKPDQSNNTFTNWRVATSLHSLNKDGFDFGYFSAINYDDLLDHPVEIGNFEVLKFNVADTPHSIVIFGHQHLDTQRLLTDVEKICNTQVNTFKQFPKMEQYIFHLWVVDNGYGGLEHRSSTSLICSRKDLPYHGMVKKNDDYIRLLGLFSHEYFHTWNVKRIKPAEFIPYQLQEESYTRQMWAFEGITSYYDDLGLLRSKVITLDEYLILLGKNINRVMNTSGRTKQSLLDSSFYTWTKFYKQDENASNAIISYYAKGALFSLCLDIKIREASNNKKSLDDVMQTLWKDYGSKQIGVEEDTICNIASKLTGTDLNEYFELYLSTTIELPLNEALAYINIELQTRPAESLDDVGGTPPSKNAQQLIQLGARLTANPDGVKIAALHEWSCLTQAGLSSGDIIIALNGFKASKENLPDLLRGYKEGDVIELHYFRDNQLKQASFDVPETSNNIYYLQLLAQDKEFKTLDNWSSL